MCYSAKYDDGLDLIIPFDSESSYGDGDLHLKVLITSELGDVSTAFLSTPVIDPFCLSVTNESTTTVAFFLRFSLS